MQRCRLNKKRVSDNDWSLFSDNSYVYKHRPFEPDLAWQCRHRKLTQARSISSLCSNSTWNIAVRDRNYQQRFPPVCHLLYYDITKWSLKNVFMLSLRRLRVFINQLVITIMRCASSSPTVKNTFRLRGTLGIITTQRMKFDPFNAWFAGLVIVLSHAWT